MDFNHFSLYALLFNDNDITPEPSIIEPAIKAKPALTTSLISVDHINSNVIIMPNIPNTTNSSENRLIAEFIS